MHWGIRAADEYRRIKKERWMGDIGFEPMTSTV
jgi:hypothetical protein